MNCSVRMMPPCWSWEPLFDRFPEVRVCFVARATPSTMTRPSFGTTCTTRPRLPLSLPVMTWTSSFFLIPVVDMGYSTSGASEMIFMNRFSRSSRATGPKIRVPRGLRCSLMSTTALSSNLMYDPSWRRFSLAVRTTTALTTSPFLTPPPGRASFTEPMITSPMPAYRRPEPPSTRMHRTSLAPVLSATRHRVSCWITLRDSPWTPSFGLLDHFDHPPPLGLRERPGLHDPDHVARLGPTVLVVRLQLGRPANDLAVQGMPDGRRDPDHHGLVHLVGHDHAGSNLPPAPLRRRSRLGHAPYSATASAPSAASFP